MLGERGGIEAAAQRGLQRRQREKEEAAAREGKFMDGAMSDSGATLTSEDNQPDGDKHNHNFKASPDLDSKKTREDASSFRNELYESRQVDKGSVQKQTGGRWNRFKKRFQ